MKRTRQLERRFNFDEMKRLLRQLGESLPHDLTLRKWIAFRGALIAPVERNGGRRGHRWDSNGVILTRWLLRLRAAGFPLQRCRRAFRQLADQLPEVMASAADYAFCLTVSGGLAVYRRGDEVGTELLTNPDQLVFLSAVFIEETKKEIEELSRRAA